MSDDSNPADTKAEKKRGRPIEPGQVLNPAGRPKGARNKLGEAFVQALHDDFEEHGIATIAKVRLEKPDHYVKVIASLLPKEIKIEATSDLNDEQLDAQIRAILGAIDKLEGGVAQPVAGKAAPPGSATAH